MVSEAPRFLSHQLPTYSPLTLRGLSTAAWSVLRSSRPSNALERALASRFDASAVRLVGSGTQALQLALRLARLTADAPVALPAYTCYDVASAAVGADSSVLFYDFEPRTLHPDLDSLRSVLARGARTVVAAYLYGFPIDWSAIRAACDERGALLIEDAAQGIGAEWDGSAAGLHGDVTVLSFGRGKGWTGGSGGALLVRRDEVGERLFALAVRPAPKLTGVRTAVSVAAQWILGRPSLYALPHMVPGLHLGETVYKEPEPPTGIDQMAAAVVLAHQELALSEVAVRRRHATALSDGYRERPTRGVTLCAPISGGACGYLRLPVLVASSALVGGLSRRLRRHGVERGYPMILPRVTPPAVVAEAAGSLPGASTLAQSLVTIPTHSLVTPGALRALPELLARELGAGESEEVR